MIYPKGDAIYENLNTSFTDFNELIADLRENNFTGSVQISFWEYEGNIFLDNGNIVNAVEEIDDDRNTGKVAVERVREKAKDKGGSISVYGLNEDMVTFLASVVQSKILHKGLSTEFTSVEGLINKLRKEEHTGFVEVNIEDGSQKSYIFFLSGEIIESLRSSGGSEISGSGVLRQIIDAASTQGATFNVYQSAIEESFAEGEEIRLGQQFPHILEVWGKVLELAEDEVAAISDKKTFMDTFKETLIAHANEYPFLDPFAAKFGYQDGEISFEGEPEKKMSEGLGVCLRETISRLDAAHPGRNVETKILRRLREVRESEMEKIARLGIEMDIPG